MTPNISKQFSEAAENIKNLVPQVTFSKNGYEIRAQMLELAQLQSWQNYHAQLDEFKLSLSIEKDGRDLVTKVTFPSVPGVEQVLETAEKFYAFVNQNIKK